jgi:hypothetical protein
MAITSPINPVSCLPLQSLSLIFSNAISGAHPLHQVLTRWSRPELDSQHAGSPHHEQHSVAKVCGARVNSTGLVFEVTACLWGLLKDRSIVGEAERPARWMPSIIVYIETTCLMLFGILSKLESAVVCCFRDQSALSKAAAHEQTSLDRSSSSTIAAQAPASSQNAVTSSGQVQPCTSLPKHQADASQSEAAVQVALEHASLLPQVSWVRVYAAAQECLVSGDHVAALAHYSTRFDPHLHVLTLLAIVGKLQDQQRRAVTALLGGVMHSTNAGVHSTAATDSNSRRIDSDINAENSSSSSSSSCTCASNLPLPEPPTLAAARREHGFTLQDLAIAFLGQEPELRDHLLLAFGTTQLPHIAMMQQSSAPHSHGESSSGDMQLSSLMHKVADTLGEATTDEYMEWMATSLLVIINEVLSQSSTSWTVPVTTHRS